MSEDGNLSTPTAAAENTAEAARPFPWKKHIDRVQSAIEKKDDNTAEQVLMVLTDVAELLPVETPTRVDLMSRLGYIEVRKGNIEGAKERFNKGIELAESAGLGEHACVAFCLDGLAECSQKNNNYPEAERLRRRAVVIADNTLGAEHPQTGFIRERLNALREEQSADALGSDEASKTLFDKLCAEYQADLTAPPPAVASATPESGGLAFLWEKYMTSGKKEIDHKNWREAEFFFRSAVDKSTSFGKGDARICESLRCLGTVLDEEGKPDEARDCYERALTIAFTQIAPNSKESAKAMAKLGDAFIKKEQWGIAKNYYRQALNAFKYSYDNDGAKEAQDKLDQLLNRVKDDNKWRGWSV